MKHGVQYIAIRPTRDYEGFYCHAYSANNNAWFMLDGDGPFKSRTEAEDAMRKAYVIPVEFV